MIAHRLLIIGGITLIIAGMIFGDVFAVFVLHQNANRIGETLLRVADAVAAKDSAAVNALFTNIGGLLENRGTKVDAHVHVIDFGYLALLLALIQPYVALAESVSVAVVHSGVARRLEDSAYAGRRAACEAAAARP